MTDYTRSPSAEKGPAMERASLKWWNPGFVDRFSRPSLKVARRTSTAPLPPARAASRAVGHARGGLA